MHVLDFPLGLAFFWLVGSGWEWSSKVLFRFGNLIDDGMKHDVDRCTLY